MVGKRKSIKDFLSDLVQLCLKSNVEFKLMNKSKVPVSGLPCNGYFEGGEENGALVVASRKPIKEWLPILVHESCHLDQWLEDKEKFMKDDGVELIDEWLNGKNVNRRRLELAIRASKKLELDCEKRSVKKMKKYNLPIDEKTYIQMANTYIYFYNWVLENRLWVPKNKKLYIKEIYSFAPTEFQSNYRKTPEELNNAITKNLC